MSYVEAEVRLKALGCLQHAQNVFLNGNSSALNTLLCDVCVGSMAAEKAILCVLVEELSEPNDIRINTFIPKCT